MDSSGLVFLPAIYALDTARKSTKILFEPHLNYLRKDSMDSSGLFFLPAIYALDTAPSNYTISLVQYFDDNCSCRILKAISRMQFQNSFVLARRRRKKNTIYHRMNSGKGSERASRELIFENARTLFPLFQISLPSAVRSESIYCSGKQIMGDSGQISDDPPRPGRGERFTGDFPWAAGCPQKSWTVVGCPPVCTGLQPLGSNRLTDDGTGNTFFCITVKLACFINERTRDSL